MTLPPVGALERITSEDAVLTRAAEGVLELLDTSGALASLDEFHLAVVSFEDAPQTLRESDYFTENCKALLARNAVVVNDAFLREAETALRWFDLSAGVNETPFIQDDSPMTGLVLRIESDPQGNLDMLRAHAGWRDGAVPEADPGLDGLTWLLLYFVAHEVGHLSTGHDQRSFGSFLKKDAVLPRDIASATVKLMRHYEEFNSLGFGLPGGEEVLDRHGAIRARVEAYRAENWEIDADHARWFADETAADARALEIVTACLKDLASRDAEEGERLCNALVRALLAVALYSWFKDLLTFARRAGLPTAGARGLTATMVDRTMYVRAAGLFGEAHRFTLLRASLAMAHLVDHGPGNAGGAAEPIWYEGDRRATVEDARERRRWWRVDNLQRMLLAYAVMDPAVKLANVGAAVPWLLEEGRRQKLFRMNFDTLSTALYRIRRLSTRGGPRKR